MTALDLYKFVTKNKLEWHWVNLKEIDVILFIPFDLLTEWITLLGPNILDEEGVLCHMKEGYMCFLMQEICDYTDINISEIFGNEKDNS